MAAATTAVVATKIVVTVLSDKRVQTVLASIIVGLVVTIFFIFGGIFTMVDYGAQNNKQAISYIFNQNEIGLDMWDIPQEYKDELNNVKARVNAVGNEIAVINEKISDDQKIDSIKARVIYLCLFPNGETTDYTKFASCFYTVTKSEDENSEQTETYAAITDESQIYTNISALFNTIITAEQMDNINTTYIFVTSGAVFLPPGSNDGPPASAYTDETFRQLMDEAVKYIGFPYVFGGSNPQTSFDCSGFVCWVYTQSGVRSLPRTTAQGIFNQCTVITAEEAKPGDLVFFTQTYNCPDPVSHIGIYVGEGKMLHCGNPISYAAINSQYWASHLYAYGRLN